MTEFGIWFKIGVWPRLSSLNLSQLQSPRHCNRFLCGYEKFGLINYRQSVSTPMASKFDSVWNTMKRHDYGRCKTSEIENNTVLGFTDGKLVWNEMEIQLQSLHFGKERNGWFTSTGCHFKDHLDWFQGKTKCSSQNYIFPVHVDFSTKSDIRYFPAGQLRSSFWLSRYQLYI